MAATAGLVVVQDEMATTTWYEPVAGPLDGSNAGGSRHGDGDVAGDVDVDVVLEASGRRVVLGVGVDWWPSGSNETMYVHYVTLWPGTCLRMVLVSSCWKRF